MDILSQVYSHPVKRVFIGYGDTAIYNTLKEMARIIKESSANYLVRRWAEKIVEGAKNDYDRVLLIYDFIVANTYYLKDPYGFELLKSPLVTLQLWSIGEKSQLDCDDYTILSLSLLKSIGFKIIVKAISTKLDKKFNHVYGLVYIKNHGWVPIDLTKPDMGLGWEYPNPTRIYEFEVK